MPVVSQVDRNSDAPIKRYVATASSYRLQLAALPDIRDPETGRMAKGRNLVAQFRHGFFETNKPEVIRLVEESYAFHDGSVKDFDALQAEAKEKRFNELKALVEEDPELLKRLKGELLETEGYIEEKFAEEAKAEEVASEPASEPTSEPTPKKKSARKNSK